MKTGYWNPKYVFLATISNTDDEEIKKILWAGASQYLNKNDIVYDYLYVAINDLETLKRLFNRKGNVNNGE